MKLFQTNFSGATNPELTPNPWDSVVEAANNNVFYGATHGFGATPGMRVQWGAGSGGIACKGKVDFTSQSRLGLPVRLSGRHTRFHFWSVFPTIAAGLANNDEITVLRAYELVQGVDTEIFSLVWIKVSNTTAKWKLTQNVGGATSITQTSAALTAIDTVGRLMTLDVICTGGEGNHFLNFGEASLGVGLIQLRIGGPTPPMASFEMGGVAASIAAPTALTEFRFDSINVVNDDWVGPHMQRSSGQAIPLLGHQTGESGKAVLTNAAYTVFGTLPTAEMANSLGVAVIPAPNMGIVPGGLYELVASPTAAVPAGGTTLLIPIGSDPNEVLPSSAISVPMGSVASWQFQAGEGQYGLIIVNAEGVAVEYSVRRLR